VAGKCLACQKFSRLSGLREMSASTDEQLGTSLAAPFCIGQVLVLKSIEGFVLSHRDDAPRADLQLFRNAEDAIEIAKYDDVGNYRALKTAPSLRHGWRMELGTWEELKRALDYFYPGRLAVFAAWKRGQLRTTSLRETLDRQSGMYRIAAKISDAQINDLVANFCRSDGGCLRTILWKRDPEGAIASAKLTRKKFDPAWDQTMASRHPASSAFAKATADRPTPATVPLLCQEPCNLLVAECRKIVKDE
jgi:4Fe-4S iron-sulfur cluster binding domain/DR2241 stabilising domain